MAGRKIVWSHFASIKLFRVLDFYTDRNKSTSYSEKIYKQFLQDLSLLDKHPEMGIKTNHENIRGLIVGNFILFYEVTSDKIIVHTLWDSRQNPDDLILK